MAVSKTKKKIIKKTAPKKITKKKLIKKTSPKKKQILNVLK